MQCKRCGSSDTAVDNTTAWCEVCGYLVGDDGPSFILAKQDKDLPRSVEEVRSIRSSRS